MNPITFSGHPPMKPGKLPGLRRRIVWATIVFVLSMLVATWMFSGSALAEDTPVASQSRGLYRLPFPDGTHVKVFDDFATHRPRGRVDIYAINGTEPYRVLAAAAGRIMAIQDGYREQQSGRPADQCHNNYVWIAHPNGEWTNYSHVAYHSVT
ncbi:MAG TPA: hypothetical protein VJU82_06010, partial [Acidobacteriaceae bacterium]|nr:hypothetical protein [Acidobacteriaceae bacterium]